MSQASPDDTAIVAELRLQDRLTALRNVRPGTQLARLTSGLAQGILQELLSLPERVNAQRWLAAERGAAVALLTLKHALNLAEMMYGSVNCVGNVPLLFKREGDEVWRQSYLRQYGGLYGALLTADGGWNAPKQAIHSSDDSSARRCLWEALRELRRQSGLLTEAAPTRSQVIPGVKTLLGDLLRLPDSVDPVRWLHAHRLALCAHDALQDILRGAIPAEPMKDLMDLIQPSFKPGEPPRALSPVHSPRRRGCAPAIVSRQASRGSISWSRALWCTWSVGSACRRTGPPWMAYILGPCGRGSEASGIARGITTW